MRCCMSWLGYLNREISRKTDITRARGRTPRPYRAIAVPSSREAAVTAQPIAPVIPFRCLSGCPRGR